MRSCRIPTVVLILLYGVFLAYWAWSGTQLPERVASHFNGSGEPNGWMSRSASQSFMLMFGFAFPLFIIGLCFAVRFLPSSVVNIPNRQYWLAPERKAQTGDFLVCHSVWMACLMVGFVTGIQYSIVQANRQSPAHLPWIVLLQVLVPFITGTVIWALVLLRRFRRTVKCPTSYAD